MQFPCPACGAPISVNPPKPGKYNPKCPKCAVPFVLAIQINPPMSGSVRAPAPRKPAAPAFADAENTLPSMPSATEDADHTFASQPAAEAESEADRTFASAPPPADDEESDRTFASAPQPEPDPDSTFATGDNQSRASNFEDRTAALPQPEGEATSDFDTQRQKAAPKPKAPAAPDEDPDALGGYEIMKRLGKGGMGSVYLARQMSLDRAVALKVMNAEFAADPVFLARFVREAYAAAQLTHHNVVQIYDIGEDDGTSFFSMEFVDGQSLGDLLKKRKAVPPGEAVGYMLQAASGLRFAHDRGMVHRDIKPDNLMLNNEGIVKVADLGLVKTRDMSKADDAVSESTEKSKPGSMLKELADVTRVGTAMGSPSYMAPEQCRDASTVDARADVYSLGCTLYALLSGRAPFTGATAVEVISKHLTEPPPPLRKVSATVPASLATIVDRTLKKDPAERFQSMEELIGELKNWQASQASGPPKPSEEQLTQFEAQVKKLKASGAGKVATVGPMVGVVAGLVALLFSPLAGGALLLGTVSAVVSGVIASGLFTGSHLFKRGREWALGARFADWLTVGAAGVFFLIGLYFAGLIGVGVGAIIGGAALGVAFGLFVAKPAHDKQLTVKEEMEGVLKRVRLAGVDEDGVRGFVVGAAGSRWERAFELLYGYPAKVQARSAFAETVAGKPKFAAWRDGLIERLDKALETRKAAKDKKLLLAVETARLKAEGLDAKEAKAKAADAADDLVEQAVDIRAANTDRKKKVDVKAVLTRYDKAKMAARSRPRRNPLAVMFRKLLRIPFDPRLRLLIGAALIVAGLMWIKQNAPTPKPGVTISPMDRFLPLVESPELAKPLSFSFLPIETTSWVNSINVLAAGLLAVFSLFANRTLCLLLMALGGAFAVVGYQLDLPIPDVPPLKPVHLCGIVGFALGALAWLLFRKGRGE